MVFVALIILMLAIMVINRLAPDRARKAEGSTMLEGIAAEESERQRVAVMAVALARAMQRETEVAAQPRAVSPAGQAGEPSRWATAGREQVMRSRGKAGRQWGRRSD